MTIAQVRAMCAAPVVTVEPEVDFPDVWQLLGFTDKGRFILLALRYNDDTGKPVALGVQVAAEPAEFRYYLCRA